MIQAISQSHSSESPSFGSYLAELVGFESITPQPKKRKLNISLLIDKYQASLNKKVKESSAWRGLEGYLVVDVEDNNQIVIFIEAPDDIADEINLIEFGTPGRPPNPLIRVSEAEFNDDFQSKRMRYL